MAYIINRSDGTELTIIDDGVLDNSTPLGLIGRNYTGYGEVQNENFVFLLENFANISPPARALLGQIWYDTSAKALKVYSNGPNNTKVWLSIGNGTVSETEPGHSVGGLWLKSTTNQLYVSDGTTWRLVGPEAAEGFSTTKLTSTRVKDQTGVYHAVIFVELNGEKTAILSADEFTLDPNEGLGPYFTDLKRGYNLKSGQSFVGNLLGNATTATKFATSRNINGVAFDGTENITIKSSTTFAIKPGDYVLGNDFDGSIEGTWNIDASPENLIGKIVARDGFGAFSANYVTADLFGDVTGNVTATTGTSSFNIVRANEVIAPIVQGNASTATKLSTPRKINTVNFDGTSDITLPVPAETLIGNTLAPNVVNSSLITLGKLEYLEVEAPGIIIGDGNNLNLRVEGFTPTLEAETSGALKLKLANGAWNYASTTVTLLSAQQSASYGVNNPSLIPDFLLGTDVTRMPVLGLPQFKWRNIYSNAATLSSLVTDTISGTTTADTVTFTKNVIVTGATYSALVGNVTGNLTGNVTGAASLNMLKAGDTLTGDITWNTSSRGLVWSMNTDSASIKYYNTADGAIDNRLEFNTGDNTNEFFRWTHTVGGSTYESMRLMPNTSGGAELTVSGAVTVSGNVTLSSGSSTFQGRGSGITDLNAFNLASGTVPPARMSGTYAINVTGNVTGNLVGNVTGNVTGNLTGNVTGTASGNLAASGGTMTGDLNWATSGRGITWGMNTDGASIRFYNVGDGDTASRLEFQTTDNGNEYFSWTHALSGGGTIESMRLVPNSTGNASLTVYGNATINGTTTGTFSGTGTSLTLDASRLTTGTVPSARLSGTYAINISGNAATATTASTATANIQRSGDTMTGRLGQHTSGFHAASLENIANRTNSGFFDWPNPSTANGWPVNGSWYHLLSSTHVNDANYYAMQFSADFYAQNLYYRSTAGSGTTAWNKILHSNNYNDYAPTKTGGGASGTWNINISGNSATVSSISSSQITNALGYIPVNPSNLTNQAGGAASFTSGTFSGQLNLSTAGIRFPTDPFGGGGDNARIVVESVGGERMRLRFYVENDAGITTVDDKAEFIVPDNNSLLINGHIVLNAANYNSYSPTLSGSGATGTWGINITGNAASASSVAWNSVSGKPNIVLNDGGTYGINISGNAGAASTAPQIYNLGNVTAESNGSAEPSSRLTLRSVYTNGYPTSYGNALTLGGAGGGELVIGWSGTTGAHADNYVRSRRDTGNTWSPWAKLITDVNYNSYSPTLSGSGATGTWPISISGNAVTVTSITSSQITTALGYTPVNPSTLTNQAGTTGSFGNIAATGNITIQKANPALLLNHVSGLDSGIELAISVQGEDFIIYEPDDGDREWFRINDTGSNGHASVYGNVSLDSSNYNDYAPTKTGTGASGTWPISISGNAATVSSVSSGQIASGLGYTPISKSGDTVNGELNLQDYNLKRATIIDYSLAHNALGSVSGGTTVNMELGNYVSATAVGSVTWTFANPPTGSRAGSIILELTNGGAFTQYWPASVRWPSGSAPSLAAAGVDVLVFITDDGGSNWRGAISMGDSR